jgi:hypothetical protein
MIFKALKATGTSSSSVADSPHVVGEKEKEQEDSVK